MGREIKLLSSKEHKSRDEISAFLRSLADRLDNGQVTLRRGQKEVILNVPHQLVLDLKVEDELKHHKGTEHTLRVKLKWYDAESHAGPVEMT